jgi:4-amino-4-deoxy-L-arabinose transferase-like glycosyltransferase
MLSLALRQEPNIRQNARLRWAPMKQGTRTRKRSRRAARAYARQGAPAARVEAPALPSLRGLALPSLRGLTLPSLRDTLQPRWIVAAAFVLLFATLLFYNLGYYYLWDDEANSALLSESVWRTGDTSAIVGHNLVAYRAGLELEGLKNRRHPPLPYFIRAPFIGLFGRSPLAARLPSALFGLLGALLVVYWLWKDNAGLRTWILVGLGACGIVSLILFSRQGRYYALAAFLSLLITYFYLHRDGRRRTIVALSLSALALLATSYLAYAGLAVGLGLGYLLFGRRRKPFTAQELAFLVSSQVVAGALIAAIWNPLSKPRIGPQSTNWIGDRLTLFARYIRSSNACEFGPGLLLAAGPILYWLTKRQNSWLVRLPIGILAYDLAITLASPQPVSLTGCGDVRYMQPTIPAFIFLGVAALESLPFPRDWPRYVGALLLFGTNLFNAATWAIIGVPQGTGADALVGGLPRSTIAAYVGELAHPLPSPYVAASDWINQNVEPGQSIFALPDYAMYPLMFHAPQAVYAWQLNPSQRPQYPMLPPIHFRGVGLPDYIMVFGYNITFGRELVDSLASQGVEYVPYAYLPAHWPDLTRPELFWHSFVEIPVGDPSSDGVFIFRRA